MCLIFLRQHYLVQVDGYICSRIAVIRSLDSLLSLSPDDEQLYSSWQYLYRAIGKFLKSSHLRRSVQSALTSCSIVFPIPQRSLAFNGKLVQNKGYE